MFNITVKTIPAHMMRYPTLGDYWESEHGVTFAVCALGDWRAEALIAIHEIVEYVLVKAAGIKVKDIDEFDIAFEQDRERGINSEDAEPGDDALAPYHLQHGLATAAERAVCAMMGLAWSDYARFCDNVIFPKVKDMGKKRK